MNMTKKKTALLALILMSMFVVGVIAGFYWAKFTIPFEVKEPLEIISKPEVIELYAGDNKTYAINITNHGSATFLVTAEFALNDTEYQGLYVTFSNINYTVAPGENTLEFWVYVAGEAPVPVSLELTVELTRATPIA